MSRPSNDWVVKLLFRLAVGLVLCGAIPAALLYYVLHNLEVTWLHIFMVSGSESLWVYLCYDITRWVKEAWDARND